VGRPDADDSADPVMNGRLDADLAPEDEKFRDELRDWLADNLTAEHRAAADISAMTDDAHFEVRLDWERRLAAAGWLGITWPERYGGRGGTLTQELLFLLEHGRAGAPHWVGIQGRNLFGPTLLHHGSQELKQRFLPPIMKATEFWGQGYSEPEAGSDLAGLRTRAVLDGDEWVIHGQKIWTSYGAYANWIYALCRTEPDAVKHKGLSLVLIPVDQPGVEVRPIRHLAGGKDFCEVFFAGARTAAANLVGKRGEGWAVAMESLAIERFTTALPYQTRFPHQISAIIEEVRRRGVAGDPVLRQRIARAVAGLRILEWSNTRLLTTLARTGDVGVWSSLSKLQWSTWHRDTMADLLDLLGPAAVVYGPDGEADGLQAAFLNARAETIYGGANEIQKTILAERALGLPRA
jgi:alkylation response protein AidB-like acyl-CoA dehydrogenase